MATWPRGSRLGLVAAARILVLQALATSSDSAWTVTLERGPGDQIKVLENKTGCSVLCVHPSAAVQMDGGRCDTDARCWYHAGCTDPAELVALITPFEFTQLGAVGLTADDLGNATHYQNVSDVAPRVTVTQHRVCIGEELFGPDNTTTPSPEFTLCLPDTPGEQDPFCDAWRCPPPCITNCTSYNPPPKEFEIDYNGHCCHSNACMQLCEEYTPGTTVREQDCSADDGYGFDDTTTTTTTTTTGGDGDDFGPTSSGASDFGPTSSRASCCSNATQTCSDQSVCTQAAATTVGTTVSDVARVEKVLQTLQVSIAMEPGTCEAQSASDIRDNVAAVATALGMSNLVDLDHSDGTCSAASRRQRRATKDNFDITLAFLETVSKADVASAVSSGNAKIAAGTVTVSFTVNGNTFTATITKQAAMGTKRVTVPVVPTVVVPKKAAAAATGSALLTILLAGAAAVIA